MSTGPGGYGRVLGRAAGFLGWTVLTAGSAACVDAAARALGVPPAPGGGYGPGFQRLLPVWGRGLVRLFGVDVRAAAPPPPPPPAGVGRLVVSNHRSPLDIPILIARHGGRTLSRADLAGWPIVGWAARGAGTIFVERGEGASGSAAIRAIRAALRAGGTVVVFPEGTTYAGDEVRTFHRGVFGAARGLEVDVVPVGLAYEPGTEFVEDSFTAHLARVAGRPRLRVGLREGAPRPLGRARADRQADALREEVQALVAQARAAL